MSVVVARLRTAEGPSFSPDDVGRWIPLGGWTSRNHATADGSAELLELSWGAALDRPFARVGSSVVAVQGYPRWRSAVEERFARAVRTPAAPPVDAVPGSVSGLVLSSGTLTAYSGASGEYGLHVRVSETEVVVSNRVAVVLGLAGDAEVDPQAAAWLAGFGWTPGGSRVWRGVRQLRPGERMTARVREGRIDVVFEEPGLGPHFTGLDGRAAGARLQEVLTGCADGVAEIDVDPARWRLPLSGGKDSRAVLGLVAAAGRLDEIGTVYTNGPPYGIDVLAASRLARAAGVRRHRVQRPPVHVGPLDLVETLLRTLDSTQGTLSAYDTHAVAAAKHLTLGGHQYAVRPDAFSDAPTGGFDEFFAHVLARKPLDPAGVLTPEARGGLERWYRAEFETLAGRGVPLDRLGDTAYWLMRAPGWLANLSGGNQYANPLLDPLLDSELLALACALPRECIHAEVVPFLAMRLSGLPLADQPFAGDRWRDDLQPMLARLGIRARVRPQVPYTTPPGLRLLADPHRPGVKVELLRLLAPAFAEILRRRQADLPFLDAGATASALRAATEARPEATPGTREMIALLGVGTVLLLSEYGLDLFDQGRRDDLRLELEQRAATGPASPAGVVDQPDDGAVLHRLVMARDDALAALAEERRHLLARSGAPDLRLEPAVRWLFGVLPPSLRTRLRRARAWARAHRSPTVDVESQR